MNRIKSTNEDDNCHLQRRYYEKQTNRPIKYISAQHAPKNYSTATPNLKREYRAYTAEPKSYRTYYMPVVTKQYVSADTMLNVRNEINSPYLYQSKQYSGYNTSRKETLPAPTGDINNHQWMYLKYPKTMTKNHPKQYVSNAGDYIREQQYYEFNKYNPQIDSNDATYFLPDKEPLYVNPAVSYKNSNNSSNYYHDCHTLNYAPKSVDLNSRPKKTVYYNMYVPPVINDIRKYSDYSTAASYEKEPPQKINPDTKGTKILFKNPKHKSIEAMVDIVADNSDVSTVYNVANSGQQIFSQFSPSKPEMVSTETGTQTCDISYLKSLLGIKSSSTALTDQATQTVLNKTEKNKKQSRCSSRQTQTTNPAEEDIQRHINLKNPKNLKESVIRYSLISSNNYNIAF